MVSAKPCLLLSSPITIDADRPGQYLSHGRRSASGILKTKTRRSVRRIISTTTGCLVLTKER